MSKWANEFYTIDRIVLYVTAGYVLGQFLSGAGL